MDENLEEKAGKVQSGDYVRPPGDEMPANDEGR